MCSNTGTMFLFLCIVSVCLQYAILSVKFICFDMSFTKDFHSFKNLFDFVGQQTKNASLLKLQPNYPYFK